MERTELADGGVLLWDAAFLAPAEADAALAGLLASGLWRQERALFGKPMPRLTAWVADAGVRYGYSGLTHEPEPWSPLLADLRDRIAAASGERVRYNSVLLNRYRGGSDSVAWHADDERSLGTNPVIGSLSLGASRRFVLRHKRTREKRELELTHGSLLVMAGTLQHHWHHAVPKTAAAVGERVNLTFRLVVTPEPAP